MKIPAGDYNKILKTMPILCVDLIVVNEKKEVLLLLRKNEPAKGEWWVPGGRVLKGEKVLETVKRKANEELGVDVEIKKFVDFYETIFDAGSSSNPRKGAHTVNLAFIVSPKNIKINLDKNHLKYRWIKKIDKDINLLLRGILIKSGIFKDDSAD